MKRIFKSYTRFIYLDKTRISCIERFSKSYPCFVQKDKSWIWYIKYFLSHSKSYLRLIRFPLVEIGFSGKFLGYFGIIRFGLSSYMSLNFNLLTRSIFQNRADADSIKLQNVLN